jgi:hypothetical protein
MRWQVMVWSPGVVGDPDPERRGLHWRPYRNRMFPNERAARDKAAELAKKYGTWRVECIPEGGHGEITYVG